MSMLKMTVKHLSFFTTSCCQLLKVPTRHDISNHIWFNKSLFGKQIVSFYRDLNVGKACWSAYRCVYLEEAVAVILTMYKCVQLHVCKKSTKHQVVLYLIAVISMPNVHCLVHTVSVFTQCRHSDDCYNDLLNGYCKKWVKSTWNPRSTSTSSAYYNMNVYNSNDDYPIPCSIQCW